MASRAMDTASDELGSFILLDALSMPPAILRGAMLMRGGGGDTSNSGGWTQAQVVLTERAVMWLLPPSAVWSAAPLTHALPQADSSPQPLGEVFELSTSRRTLRFRCRSRDMAERWVAALTLACETQSDSSIAEMAELLSCDYTESALQWRLLDAAAGGRAPTAQRLLALSRAGRVPLSVGGGGGGGFRGGGGAPPTLLPPPRGRFDIAHAALPSEGAIAGALAVARRASGSGVGTAGDALAGLGVPLAGASRWRPLLAAGMTAPRPAAEAAAAEEATPAAAARLRRIFGPRAAAALQVTPAASKAATAAAASSKHTAGGARRRAPATSLLASLPAELVAPVRSTLLAAITAATAAGGAAAAAAAVVPTRSGDAAGPPSPRSRADAALRRALTGAVPLLLECLALCGAEPALLGRAIDAAAARAAARDAITAAQALAGRRQRAAAQPTRAAPPQGSTRRMPRAALQQPSGLPAPGRDTMVYLRSVSDGQGFGFGLAGGRGAAPRLFASPPPGDGGADDGGLAYPSNATPTSGSHYWGGGGGEGTATSRSGGALSSALHSSRGLVVGPASAQHSAPLNEDDDGGGAAADDADIDVATLANFLAVGIPPAVPIAATAALAPDGGGHAPRPHHAAALRRQASAPAPASPPGVVADTAPAPADAPAGAATTDAAPPLEPGAAPPAAARRRSREASLERGASFSTAPSGAAAAPLLLSSRATAADAIAGALAAVRHERMRMGRLSDDDRGSARDLRGLDGGQ